MGNKRFPLFIDLTGRPAVVVGGGTVGLRRAKALRRFGAEVTLISPRLSGEAGGLRYIPRAYRPGDLEGAFLAVAAADDPAVNAAVGREAQGLGIFFNRADCRDECGFFFPALCETEGLVAGVAGDGGNHRQVAEAARRIRLALGGCAGEEARQ